MLLSCWSQPHSPGAALAHTLMVTIDVLRQDMHTRQGEHGLWLLWVQHRAGKQGQLWDVVAQSWEWRQLCQAPSPVKGILEPRHTARACSTSWERSYMQQSCSAQNPAQRPRVGCTGELGLLQCPAVISKGSPRKYHTVSHGTAKAMHKQRASEPRTLRIMKRGGASCWHMVTSAAGRQGALTNGYGTA